MHFIHNLHFLQSSEKKNMFISDQNDNFSKQNQSLKQAHINLIIKWHITCIYRQTCLKKWCNLTLVWLSTIFKK